MHYGESHGYDKDKPRPNAWPYRDYVIRSFNDDKPYDRFVAEQIAGDVLDPGNPQALVATGFIAAGPWDFVGHVELREGTTDKEIARSNDRDDMLANAMSTFVSLTVHCARCHNHKFDPIRQADYYALQAVFAGVDRGDRPYDADPEVAHRRLALVAEKQWLDSRLEALRQQLAAVTSPGHRARSTPKSRRSRPSWPRCPNAENSKTLGYHSQIMSDQNATKWVQVDLGQSYPFDEIVIVPAHEVYGGHPGPGFGFPPRYRVEVADDAEFATSHVVADHTAADVPHPGDRWQRIDRPGVSGRYVRVTATKLWKRTGDWIFALGELVVLVGRQERRPRKAGDSPRFDRSGTELGPGQPGRRIQQPSSGSTTAEGLDLRRQELEKQLQQAAQSAAPSGDRGSWTRRRAAKFAAAEARLPEVEQEIAALPEQQSVYATRHDFEPRPIHLLARGDVGSPQELMAPGAVACVQGPDANFDLDDSQDEGQRRAALAGGSSIRAMPCCGGRSSTACGSITSGAGLVDSPNDFGRMGSLPTHPELLEWLAGWFADHGHSLKELHRLLLTSAVYRQSSRSNPAHEQVDAGNRYLWRMNRARLDAECVRDAMLYVSGKLDFTMGGPSVQQFFFKDDHSPVYDYARFDVDDPRSLRRSV